MKEKEIWGRVEFLWDKVNGRLIFFDQVFFSRTDQRTSLYKVFIISKKEKVDCLEEVSSGLSKDWK